MSSNSMILDRYRASAPFSARAFLFARWHWTPYLEMSALLPPQGTILDIGCGHGLLSMVLATESPKRQVLGVDHDRSRIHMAQSAGRGIPNLIFRIGDFSILESGPVAGITCIDVLHYFPIEDQQRILSQAFRALEPGGILLFREVDPRAGLTSWVTRFHENIMTRMGFTQASELHFRTREQWKSQAESAGFEVALRPCHRFPFADVLFHCRKPAASEPGA